MGFIELVNGLGSFVFRCGKLLNVVFFGFIKEFEEFDKFRLLMFFVMVKFMMCLDF